MTYCVAIKLNSALVFASDSRTNAGADQLATYSKMFRWGIDGERQFILLSAGNLATTQSVVTRIKRDIKEKAEQSLLKMKYLSDAADYIGKLGVEERARHIDTDGVNAGFNPEATFILGGQIRGDEPDVFLIYPQGNHIAASSIKPHLQIGETKYGKPILDRIVRPDTDVDAAVKCALVSMDSTMRSNATVGPPIELTVYSNESLGRSRYQALSADDPYLLQLKSAWGHALEQAFNDLPGLQMPATPA